jgi:hypothetical protein
MEGGFLPRGVVYVPGYIWKYQPHNTSSLIFKNQNISTGAPLVTQRMSSL